MVHAILDNYAAHKHPRVLVWLGRHPRWTFHFTPTSGSWLNAVETFFSALTRRRIRRGSFRSIVDLQAAINRYIAEHNTDPKPFTWTKPADQILAEADRRCVRALAVLFLRVPFLPCIVGQIRFLEPVVILRVAAHHEVFATQGAMPAIYFIESKG